MKMSDRVKKEIRIDRKRAKNELIIKLKLLCALGVYGVCCCTHAKKKNKNKQQTNFKLYI